MVLVALHASAAHAGADAPQPQERQQQARGARLFDGREALRGVLEGHSVPLPARATSCVQCHRAPSPGASPSFAPPLNADQLRSSLPRRGGPPVAYDLPAFCRALRQGIDPAHVVLPRGMPRYTLNDAQCAALWTHLTR